MNRSTALLVSAVLLVSGLGACSSDSEGDAAPSTTEASGSSTTAAPSTTEATTTVPDPLDDQTPPANVNGLTVQGDTIWVASIEADEVLQIDRETGAILARFDTDGAGPDDVAVAPDGSIWVTGFGNGDLGRIADGTYEVVTTMTAGINPLEFTADGTLLVGTYGPGGTLYEVPTDGGEPVVLAEDLPDINAFGTVEDGSVLAPAGGIGGPGSVVRIDLSTGEVTTVVADLDPVAAGATDAAGTFFVLSNITGEVLEVDVEAGTATRFNLVPTGAPFDNLAFADDGTLYLSSFGAPSITEISPQGDVRQIAIGG
jgi:sugar lactone lactonase YvrE